MSDGQILKMIAHYKIFGVCITIVYKSWFEYSFLIAGDDSTINKALSQEQEFFLLALTPTDAIWQCILYYLRTPLQFQQFTHFQKHF